MKKRQGAYREFTNIRILPSGYQVAITRNKKEYSKHFAGHSKDALKAAHHWRDKVLRLLPNKRSQPIPSRILTKLRLKQPVVGVSRYGARRFYSVTYHGAKGRTRVRTFSWRDPKGELAAYSASADEVAIAPSEFVFPNEKREGLILRCIPLRPISRSDCW
ncbi:MAG: hypothetical protein DMF40_11285 [Verrucomicrobia bacterium]|nr:MAG: hypothetical protein DMF40_11285 [Verrucomicrobiota bacterium]